MVAAQRREDEIDQRLTLAWTIEMLHRQKKLPALRTLLSKAKSKPRPQSVPEQRAMLHMLSQQYGIPLRKGKRGG